MHAIDALIVVASFAAGCLTAGVLSKGSVAMTWWRQRRAEDAEFRRSLALGGRLTSSGERTGVHSTGHPVAEIVARETAAEATGEYPIVHRLTPDGALCARQQPHRRTDHI
jgi:hypothetical protein